MSLIYVFSGSKMEWRAVTRLIRGGRFGRGVFSGRAGPNEVVSIRTGMGLQNARSGAARALGANRQTDAQFEQSDLRHPDMVLVVGLAGSLSLSIAEGEIVAYSECLSTELAETIQTCSPDLTDHIARLLKSAGLDCKIVTGVSSPRIATSPAEKRSLAMLGAEAVDMESFEIIAAANRDGIPAAVVRAVSDSFEREIPDFNPALRSNGEFDPLTLARLSLASPRLTAGLFFSSKNAIRNLSRAIEAILPGCRPAPEASSQAKGEAARREYQAR